MPPKNGTYKPNKLSDTPTWTLAEGEETHKDIYDLQTKEITKYELQRMMDSTKAKLEAMMDTKIDGFKGEIMEGLKKILIERPHESDNVSHEIQDEDTLKMNQDWRNSSFGLKTKKFSKIDMRNFDGKDPIIWILHMEKLFDLHDVPHT
jgi:hypothetical protein